MKTAMILEIDGEQFDSIKEFHELMAACEAFPDFYGRNFDAFHDSLSGMIERPFKIIWRNASVSEKKLGVKFEILIEVMREAQDRDIKLGRKERFEYELIG